MKGKVALVSQDLTAGGGVATMTSFLYRVLKDTPDWEPEIISLATSAVDSSSVRVLNVPSWRRGIRSERLTWRGIPYTHVGAGWVEFEPQRYRPRKELDRILERYDLIQFVAGSPAPLCAAARLDKPRLLWAATTVRADRVSRLNTGPRIRQIWSKLMLRFVERQERTGLKLAHHVFALSEYTFSALARMGAGPLSLAPCGVDTELFSPQALPGDYFICVARLYDARKNVPLLLRAYAQLRSSVSSCPKLCLVGELPTPATIRLLQKLGLEGSVLMMGAQAPHELAKLYRNARLFVLSSDEEGLGIVILEAMASGLPIISTASGGPSTLVEEGRNGFLTPVGEAKPLADAMRRLLQDPALAEGMGRRSREIAVERFSRAAVGEIFLREYRRVASRGK